MGGEDRLSESLGERAPSIVRLESQVGGRWEAMRAAARHSQMVLSELRSALEAYEDPALSVVVTGSIARGESSPGSDADWMLLIDGPSDPSHGALIHEISERIETVVSKGPGRTRTFGTLVSSHELVHRIAGAEDSNRNLTHRILLLSKSQAVTGGPARERVIRNILARYVVHDRSVPSGDGTWPRVPQFLVNDVVRYWRTMATDYASKMWERQRDGWATRNVKLRFSRKVLYMWGLLASFSADLDEPETLKDVKDESEFNALLAEHIRSKTNVMPLELLAQAVLNVGDDDIARDIFGSYDHFLGALSNRATRARLDGLAFDDALGDATYGELREKSKAFRDAVRRLFMERHPKLPELIRRFGVF